MHARAASDACIAIHVDNAVRPLAECIHRANRYAGRIGAMVAALYQEVPLNIREFPHFDVLDRSPKAADGHVVFRFASGRAGMATDASIVIYDEAVLHARRFYT